MGKRAAGTCHCAFVCFFNVETVNYPSSFSLSLSALQKTKHFVLKEQKGK